MRDLIPFPTRSTPPPSGEAAPAPLRGRWPLGAGLTPRGFVGLTLTMLLSGALMVILLVRLIGASQAVASAPPYPLVGHPAPGFTVTLWNGTSGQTLRLADLKGKVVVLNFWASWCESCTQELPALESAYQQYQAKGVVFVGLAYGDTPEHGKPFLQKYGVTYPSGPDGNGAISVAYGVTGVPETIFIGRDGKIASKAPGGVDASSLDAGLRGIIK
jgi:cytochrome c biogenesis protein CcmG/thiol:disulfide interchange protein DsbE